MFSEISAERTAKYLPSILKKFYRTELRDGEDVIDNRDDTIAKELNIPMDLVSKIIKKHLKDKYDNK